MLLFFVEVGGQGGSKNPDKTVVVVWDTASRVGLYVLNTALDMAAKITFASLTKLQQVLSLQSTTF